MQARLTLFYATGIYLAGLGILALVTIPLTGLQKTTAADSSTPGVLTGAGSGIGPQQLMIGAAFALVLLIPIAARAFVRGVVLLAAACVWLATSLSTGVSIWTMLATIWQGAAGALATPAASAALWGLVVMGALALYWLQRLLGSEEE